MMVNHMHPQQDTLLEYVHRRLEWRFLHLKGKTPSESESEYIAICVLRTMTIRVYCDYSNLSGTDTVISGFGSRQRNMSVSDRFSRGQSNDA